MRSAIAIAAALALVLALAPAAVALADEGPAPTAPPAIRPPLGVLRHVDAPRASAAPTGTARKEVVILVGGYQSCACDRTFDALVDRLTAAGFDVRRFGADPAHPYDTYGPVDRNARALRDEIRSTAGRYAAVHLVTHSMGGVVADAAFASGLSRGDGVVSYVSWAAPHNGSQVAGLASAARAAFGGDGGPFRDAALAAGFETDSDAIRDLARARPAKPPEGVVRLNVREMTDLLVTARDGHTPGVATRTLGGAVEGHGGILTDPEALDLTVRTISTRRVPPDPRPRAVEPAARTVSFGLGVAAVCLLGLCLPCVLALGRAARSPVARAITQRLPVARTRRRCP